jgi:tRNA (cmo5U34)-methyltransferase
MKFDNTTSHLSSKYDSEISKTIPYYDLIHNETLNFVKAYIRDPQKWLDTGCGTGTFGVKVMEDFNLDELVLSDPSEEMLSIAKNKISKSNVKFICSDTISLDKIDNDFDVITAIQSHHYLSKIDRYDATDKCYRLLKPSGLFITFENTRPISDVSIRITKNYWKSFQITQGKSLEQAENHMNRFDKEYFPISIDEAY